MSFDPAASLPLILLGLALLVLAIWLLSRLGRKARIVDQNATTTTDVLSEGADRAKRNQALIDSPTGSPMAASLEAPLAIADIQGPLSAAANTQTIAAAPMDADAEAGASVAPPPAAMRNAPAGEAVVPHDDLARLKGVGPKLVTLLGELGVTSFAQIAAWDDAAIERVDGQLGRFRGRIRRDQWVEQAQLLAGGDEAAHSQQYGQSGRD